MTDRPWVDRPPRLGTCDDCAEVWLIERPDGTKACRAHHRILPPKETHR